MKTYEYLTEQIFPNRQQSLRNILNEFGVNGWKLITITNEGNFIFIRCIEEVLDWEAKKNKDRYDAEECP